MDWCCLAGLLAGGVPPGRIRIWGILISLHLFSLSGTHFVGGRWVFPFWGTLWRGQVCERGKHSELAKAVSPSRALPLLATQLFCVLVGVGLVVERCADSEVGGREGGPLAGLFPGWSIFVELYICFGNILWSR